VAYGLIGLILLLGIAWDDYKGKRSTTTVFLVTCSFWAPIAILLAIAIWPIVALVYLIEIKMN